MEIREDWRNFFKVFPVKFSLRTQWLVSQVPCLYEYGTNMVPVFSKTNTIWKIFYNFWDCFYAILTAYSDLTGSKTLKLCPLLWKMVDRKFWCTNLQVEERLEAQADAKVIAKHKRYRKALVWQIFLLMLCVEWILTSIRKWYQYGTLRKFLWTCTYKNGINYGTMVPDLLTTNG